MAKRTAISIQTKKSSDTEASKLGHSACNATDAGAMTANVHRARMVRRWSRWKRAATTSARAKYGRTPVDELINGSELVVGIVSTELLPGLGDSRPVPGLVDPHGVVAVHPVAHVMTEAGQARDRRRATARGRHRHEIRRDTQHREAPRPNRPTTSPVPPSPFASSPSHTATTESALFDHRCSGREEGLRRFALVHHDLDG